jgi:autophagy-related protein 2
MDCGSPPDKRVVFPEQAEVFPVDLKLDYKPRRVDYRALKEGKTIELMNFFHFDGAEMTLRHITLTGVSYIAVEIMMTWLTHVDYGMG